MLIAALAALASCLLIYAALHDLAARTVPNWLSLAVLAVGCVWRLLDHSLLAGVLAGIVTFICLFAVWLLGGMGGGDVKLWAASALLIPPLLFAELAFVLHVVLFGGALAILYLGLCRIVSIPEQRAGAGWLRRLLRVEAWRIGRGAPLPYACAIAGGAISTFLPLSLQR